MAAFTPAAAVALVVDRRDARDSRVNDHSLYCVDERYKSSSVKVDMVRVSYLGEAVSERNAL